MDEQRKRMTAKRKLEVYVETRQKDALVGEVLRRIETLVEQAALAALKGRRQGQGADVTGGKEYDDLVAELAQKEKALAELTVEYTLLKKSERSGWKAPSMVATSTANGGRR